jgi:hypothetical protein
VGHSISSRTTIGIEVLDPRVYVLYDQELGASGYELMSLRL